MHQDDLNEKDEFILFLWGVLGKITGAAAKAELIKSKLPNSVLAKVWRLADYDKDGMLDCDEWALANYLIKIKVDGHELPNALPDHLVPPSKRKLYPNLNGSSEDYIIIDWYVLFVQVIKII